MEMFTNITERWLSSLTPRCCIVGYEGSLRLAGFNLYDSALAVDDGDRGINQTLLMYLTILVIGSY